MRELKIAFYGTNGHQIAALARCNPPALQIERLLHLAGLEKLWLDLCSAFAQLPVFIFQVYFLVRAY